MLLNADLGGFISTIVALLCAAHLGAYLMQRLGLPRVVGEIAGGFVLGPTVLGLFGDQIAGFVISQAALPQQLLAAFYWLGLILLMFVSGFHVGTRPDRSDGRIVLILFAAATVLPMLGGLAAAQLFPLEAYVGPRGSALTITLIFCVAVAVTSIPVISKIFLDLGIMQTRFARLVLTASTLQDVVLWGAVAVATGLAAMAEPPEDALGTSLVVAGKTLAFCAIGLAAAPLALRLAGALGAIRLLRSAKLGFVLAWCFLLAYAALALDVNVIFGALVAGVGLQLVGPDRLVEEKRQVTAFSLGFFVPLYFAVVGYRLDLVAAFDVWLFLGFLALSSALEIVCVFAAMRLAGSDRLTSLNFGIAMNTRGGPGIVLASIAFDFGIVDARVYVAFVLAAIATSLASGAWFAAIVRRGLPLMR